MKQNNNEINYPKYLSDTPINKPSEIANTIVNEILSDTKKNRIIGLLGSWGSGKSSAVENIKEQINNYCEIFEYDAWENEKFPFKLGFLKKIIKDIKSTNNDTSTLEQKLKELEQLSEKQEAKEYAFINFENLLTAIPLLFYPFAFNLLDEKYKFLYIDKVEKYLSISYFEHVCIYFLMFSILYIINRKILKKTAPQKSNIISVFSDFRRNLVISENKIEFLLYELGDFLNIILSVAIISFVKNLSALIILLPLIMWLLFNFSKFILKCINPKNDFYILSGTTPEIKSLITINKSPEPSLIDFQNLYQEILEYNDKTKCKPCLIIIDNIDRIDISEARKIWATLKGMILKNNNCIHTNIIIPVDEEQILKLYEDDSQEEIKNDNKSASFIQKTFDITYRISPFIMDNIKSFLYEKLDEAFGKDFFSEEDRLNILNIFNSRNFSNNKDYIASSYVGQATPRKIIKMINEVVSIQKNKTFEEIPPVVKFAYIVHYNNISEKLQNKFLKNLLPNDSLTLINIENNERAKLISLYYGVNETLAIKIAKKEDLTSKLYDSDFDIDENITSIENIWSIIEEITNESILDKPYSLLTMYLQNLMNLQKQIPSENFNILLNNIMDQVIKQSKIDNFTNLHTDTICNALQQTENISIPDIISLAFTFEDKNNFSDSETKEWLNLVKSIMSKFKIEKTAIDDKIGYIPESLYTNAIRFLKEGDYELLDSYMLEVSNEDEEKILNNSNVDVMYNNIKFIISAPPVNDHKEEWIAKINKLVPIIKKLLNDKHTNAIDLLYRMVLILKSNNASLCDYIKSEEYYSNVLNQIFKETKLLAKAFAIEAFMEPSLSASQNYCAGHPTLSNWKTVFNDTSEDFIQEFSTAYIHLNSDALAIFDLSPKLQNLQQIINYVASNIDNFNMNTNKFISLFNKFNKEHRDIFFNKFMQYEDAKSLLKSLKFDNDNTELLYYLSLNSKILKYIKENAEEYLQTIEEESWENEAKNCSKNFKIAINIKSQSAYFKNILSKLGKIIIDVGINKFITSMSNELDIIREYDDTYNFINDLLDNNLKTISDNIEILIDNFEKSVINWLSKTSHNNYTIYTDFIRKIKNSNWMVNNNILISKYIDSDENKQNFVEIWNNDDDVKNAYSEIFQYVLELNNESESQ